MPAHKKTLENGVIGRGLPGPGRPKGKPNKLTRDVKEMVLTALNDAGGAEYLRKQADANPSAFLTLVGKLLPKQLTGENGQPLSLCAPQFIIQPMRPRYEVTDEELIEIALRKQSGKPE